MELHIEKLPELIVRKVFNTKLSLNIYVIRDDLLHPFISGNKYRKLKGFLRITKEQSISQWITFGGPWSNHLLATACAGATHQIKTLGYVRGEPVKNPILFLCRQWGMELRFVSIREYRRLTQKVYVDPQITNGTLWIPEGGAGEWAFEGLKDLMNQIPTTAHYVFTAVGTATTLAGLCSVEHPAKRAGVLVLKAPEIFNRYQDKVLQEPLLFHEYTLGGYAKTPPPYLSFLTKFSQYTSILLDPIYTGKMVFAVHELIQKNYFEEGTNLYLLHTGGLTGILGNWEKYPD